VTPISTATNKAGKVITVGSGPRAFAITPNGKTAYVVSNAGIVTPITTTTSKAGKAINISGRGVLYAIAITPNGETAYVVDFSSDTVIPIQTATNRTGKAIRVGNSPEAIAITP